MMTRLRRRAADLEASSDREASFLRGRHGGIQLATQGTQEPIDLFWSMLFGLD